jgi:hypothetical protein
VLLAVVSFDASLICKFGLEKDWRCVCKFKVRSPEDNTGKWYWVIDLVRLRGNKMAMQAIKKGKARPGIGCNTTRKEASQTLEVDCLIDMLSGRSAPNLIRHTKRNINYVSFNFVFFCMAFSCLFEGTAC